MNILRGRPRSDGESEVRRPCDNEGCRNAAPPGQSLCEACDMERSLYRREERPGVRGRTAAGASRG